MTIQPGNLFAGVADVSAANIGEEAFSEILAWPGLKIERIISQGHTSPPGFWYDQAWNEWVIVLKGSATLQFEHEPAARSLGVGDYVFIPARKRHRVEWTQPQQPTVWLAVHFRVSAYRNRISRVWDHASHPFADAARVDTRDGRGRDEDCSSPPAQIPACAANAPGSSLGSDVVR